MPYHQLKRGQRLCILFERLQRSGKGDTILYDRFLIYRTVKLHHLKKLKKHMKMIYLISQITFIFLTQIKKYEFHHIVINFITRYPWHFEINLCRLLLEDFLCSTKKMHISEYVCKTCLKKLRILLKCRETFEKFLAT